MKPSCAAALVLAALAVPSAAEAQSRPMRGGSERPAPAGEAPPPRQTQKQFPLGASYVAVSVKGRPVSGDRPAMTLDDTFRIRGYGGCRNYSAVAYTLREQGIAVGPLALTKKSCDKGRMAVEEAYLVALRTAQKWETQEQNRVLILTGPNGEIRFERAL